MTAWISGTRQMFAIPRRADGSPVPRVLSIPCVSVVAAGGLAAEISQDFTPAFALGSVVHVPWTWTDNTEIKPGWVADRALNGGRADPHEVGRAVRVLVQAPTPAES